MRHYRVRIMRRAIEILTRKRSGDWSTLAQDRVYRQEYSPLSDDPDNNARFIPAIVMYTTQETNERIDWTQDRRTIDLAMELFANTVAFDPANDPDAGLDLDEMEEQVLNVIRRDQSLEGVVESIHYKSSEWLYDKDSRSNVVGVRVTFECKYVWDSTSTLALDDLNEVGVTWQVGGGGDTVADTIAMADA